MTEKEIDAALAENVARGFLVVNEDGTYSMTEAGKDHVETKMGTITIPRAQHEALMAGAFWLLKLRSLGYINAGHGRKIVDEILSVIRATGIEIKADSERDERLRAIGRRAAGIETEG